MGDQIGAVKTSVQRHVQRTAQYRELGLQSLAAEQQPVLLRPDPASASRCRSAGNGIVRLKLDTYNADDQDHKTFIGAETITKKAFGPAKPSAGVAFEVKASFENVRQGPGRRDLHLQRQREIPQRDRLGGVVQRPRRRQEPDPDQRLCQRAARCRPRQIRADLIAAHRLSRLPGRVAAQPGPLAGGRQGGAGRDRARPRQGDEPPHQFLGALMRLEERLRAIRSSRPPRGRQQELLPRCHLRQGPRALDVLRQ